MGQGLGKGGPVVLSLGKGNYEALISRHGQYIRWRTARKCTCVTPENEKDPHCEKCGGSGEVYDYQKFYNETLRLSVRDNILELPVENADCEVLKVYDAYGNEFHAVKIGQFVEIIGGSRLLNKNEIVELLIRDTLVKHIESVVLERIGSGYYRVPGVETPPSQLEGVYYKAAGDVIAADRVENSVGEAVEITGFRQNMIQVDPAVPQMETLTAYEIDYILPFKFLVLSQNLNKDDSLQLQIAKGDAVCTYPYMFNVGFGDVITVLSGTMPMKDSIKHISDDADDVIFEYFVSRIDKLETHAGEYREGVDFILVGTNRIHWIGENRPEIGAVMSISYQFRPTYRVAKNIPQLRTSEDQRIPRKVILQSLAAFKESRRLNQNG